MFSPLLFPCFFALCSNPDPAPSDLAATLRATYPPCDICSMTSKELSARLVNYFYLLEIARDIFNIAEASFTRHALLCFVSHCQMHAWKTWSFSNQFSFLRCVLVWICYWPFYFRCYYRSLRGHWITRRFQVCESHTHSYTTYVIFQLLSVSFRFVFSAYGNSLF